MLSNEHSSPWDRLSIDSISLSGIGNLAAQDEMARIDRRIAELQDRLTRKRMMNQQLANQINAATTAKQAQLRAIQVSVALKILLKNSKSVGMSI